MCAFSERVLAFASCLTRVDGHAVRELCADASEASLPVGLIRCSAIAEHANKEREEDKRQYKKRREHCSKTERAKRAEKDVLPQKESKEKGERERERERRERSRVPALELSRCVQSGPTSPRAFQGTCLRAHEQRQHTSQ